MYMTTQIYNSLAKYCRSCGKKKEPIFKGEYNQYTGKKVMEYRCSEKGCWAYCEMSVGGRGHEWNGKSCSVCAAIITDSG